MATQKQVQILATYYHKTNGKLNGTVTYLVRASNGVDTYCTTLIEGVASGCSCPSRSPKGCYHKHQLETREQDRWIAFCQELAKKLATQYWTTQCVEQIAESLIEMPAQDVVSPKIEQVASEVGITVEQAQEIAAIALDYQQEIKPKHTDMTLPIGPRDTKKDIMRKSNLNGAQQSAGLLMELPSRKARAS